MAILTIGASANTQVVCPESQLGFQVQSAEAQHDMILVLRQNKPHSSTDKKKNPASFELHRWMIGGPNRHFWCSVYWFLLKHCGPQTVLKFSEGVFLAEASISLQPCIRNLDLQQSRLVGLNCKLFSYLLPDSFLVFFLVYISLFKRTFTDDWNILWFDRINVWT